MDWMMPVNEILKDDITKINYKLMPPHFKGDIRATRVMQDSLTRLIDVIGEQSTAAQGLNRAITTADKLRNSPTHILYLLKDARAKGGKGELIGLLKVGHKHLFLFNENDKVCEVEPLCVLDFFVLKDRQRAGYGKILFDHMLQDMQTTAKELAIDGPSTKMELFLRKNYGVDTLIRQNNNFAVSPDFFKLVPDMSKSGRCTPVEAPPVGRFAAPKPQSAIASVIHGPCSHYDEASDRDESAEARDKANARVKPSAPPLPDASEQGQKPEPKQESKPEPKPEPAEPELVAEIVANTKSPERPSTLSVEPVAETGLPIPAISPAGSTISRRGSQLTEQGFFDVKFYHNKLCKSCRCRPVGAPVVGRFAAPKPPSTIASVIHGPCSHYDEASDRSSMAHALITTKRVTANCAAANQLRRPQSAASTHQSLSQQKQKPRSSMAHALITTERVANRAAANQLRRPQSAASTHQSLSQQKQKPRSSMAHALITTKRVGMNLPKCNLRLTLASSRSPRLPSPSLTSRKPYHLTPVAAPNLLNGGTTT